MKPDAPELPEPGLQSQIALTLHGLPPTLPVSHGLHVPPPGSSTPPYFQITRCIGIPLISFSAAVTSPPSVTEHQPGRHGIRIPPSCKRSGRSRHAAATETPAPAWVSGLSGWTYAYEKRIHYPAPHTRRYCQHHLQPVADLRKYRQKRAGSGLQLRAPFQIRAANKSRPKWLA